MKDKVTKNKDGSTTVVREATDPYPDSIPFDEYDQKPYADSVEPVEIVAGADDALYYQAKSEAIDGAVSYALNQVKLLTAHLVSKGYGQATIRRILAGEVVR